MEKTIFILREGAWDYENNALPCYLGADKIYKKFATYKEALAEKNRLEINRVCNSGVNS